MTEYIHASPSLYKVSITLAIFDDWQQVTRRKFPLRNLTGETEHEQVAEATKIMAEVAAELYYITGYGIDKGTVHLDGKKANEVVYEGYQPHEKARYFRFGVKIGFQSAYQYMWVNGRQKAPRIAKDRLSEGWQRQPVERFKAISFRLPCMAGTRSKEHFFQEHGVRKRGRKRVGWRFYYDQNMVDLQGRVQKKLEITDSNLQKFEYNADVSWSPNGKQVAFSLLQKISPNRFQGDVFLLSLDDQRITQITNTPEWDDENVTWSSNGEQIAFVSVPLNSTSEVAGRLTVGNADGSCNKMVSSPIGIVDVSWGPDLTNLAVIAEGKVYILDIASLEGGDLVIPLVCP